MTCRMWRLTVEAAAWIEAEDEGWARAAAVAECDRSRGWSSMGTAA